MAPYDFPVIDDLGLIELDMDKCRDLFEIIENQKQQKAYDDCFSTSFCNMLGAFQ